MLLGRLDSLPLVSSEASGSLQDKSNNAIRFSCWRATFPGPLAFKTFWSLLHAPPVSALLNPTHLRHFIFGE